MCVKTTAEEVGWENGRGFHKVHSSGMCTGDKCRCMTDREHVCKSLLESEGTSVSMWMPVTSYANGVKLIRELRGKMTFLYSYTNILQVATNEFADRVEQLKLVTEVLQSIHSVECFPLHQNWFKTCCVGFLCVLTMIYSSWLMCWFFLTGSAFLLILKLQQCPFVIWPGRDGSVISVTKLNTSSPHSYFYAPSSDSRTSVRC